MTNDKIRNVANIIKVIPYQEMEFGDWVDLELVVSSKIPVKDKWKKMDPNLMSPIGVGIIAGLLIGLSLGFLLTSVLF